MPRKKSQKATYDFNGTEPNWNTKPATGLAVPDEMKDILARGEYISIENGAQRLRHLYSDCSMGFTPAELSSFGQACFTGQLKAVKEAVESGAAPDLGATETAFNQGYATQIINGSQRIASLPDGPETQHYEVMKYLIPHGLALSVPDIGGYTALHHSVLGTSLRDKEALIRLMLEAGADVNYRNRFGEIPLFNAMQRGDALGVELFMEYGADIDLADPNGGTPRNSYIPCGPQVTAVMRKWIMKRRGQEAPLMEKKCDHCGDKDKPLKMCAKCHAVQYCSVTCQRAQWSMHKKVCLPFDTSTTVSVVPWYQEFGTNLPRSPLERGVVGGLPTDPVPASHLRTAHTPKLGPSGKRLIIKIQVPPRLKKPDGSYNDLYVYDKKRDFVCFIQRQNGAEQYDRIVHVVKSQGVAGLKAYFAAELKTKQELVVKVSEVMAVQSF